MTAINEGLLSGWQNDQEELEKKVSLASLSELTGFPVEFIKKELLIEKEPISMRELRESMMAYLEASAPDILN